MTLCVALFLLVQAFVSGISIGARAGTPELSLGVICSTIGTKAPNGGQPSDPTHFNDCCTLGCSMVGGQPLPESATLELPSATPLVLHAPSAARSIEVARFELAPLHTRAPPKLA